MPIGPTKTKAQKAKVVKTEMHKFGEGKLHSGSKKGPVVTNPKQAIAISLSESGQSKNKAPPVGKGESKGAVDRSAHHKGNPGFGKVPEGHKPKQTFSQEQAEHFGPQAAGNPPSTPVMPSRVGSGPVAGSHGFGHSVAQCKGGLRMSGCSTAHRIGAKRK
jgi:hypothetical protein